MSAYIICEECDGTGEVMDVRLYPQGPTEIMEECENCSGNGEVEE